MNIIIKLILFFSFVLICVQLQAQTWSALTTGTDSQVRCMYTDITQNVLYVGGGFKTAGNLNARGIAKWDGTSWDRLGQGMDDSNSVAYPGNVLTITKYKNQIYVGGVFQKAGGIPSEFLAIWADSFWIGRPFTINESIIHLDVHDNKLILAGGFTRINNASIIFYAAYDSINIFSPNLNVDSTFGGGFTYANYNNYSFYGGNLFSTIGEDLFRWDSTASGIYSMGILGNSSYVTSMVNYKNELYIAGNFQKANGNIGDNILKWDGNTFTEVGGGVNSQVNCMKVINGDLYVAGIFTMAGNIPVTRIARWDGLTWHALNNTTINNGISSIEYFNNELYIGGGFTEINNIPMYHIAKYNGILSVDECIINQINIYPNPTNNFLYIKSDKIRIDEIVINSILSKENYFCNNIKNNMLNISFLNPGIYFLTLSTPEGRVVKRFIKE